MFDPSCSIRSDFLSSLKDLLFSKNFEKQNCTPFKEEDLPQKEGIFQHVPLYNLYQNKFVLAGRGKVKKSDIKNHVLEDSLFSHLVFVNGELDLTLSDISLCKDLIEINEKSPSDMDNLKSSSFDSAAYLKQKKSSFKEEYNFFASLNRLFSKKELRLNIKEQAILPTALQILHIISSDIEDFSLISPRVFINFGKNSDSKVVFSGYNFSKNSPFWLNETIYLNVEDHATVNVYSDYPLESKSYLFQHLRSSVKAEGELNICSSMSGAKIEHRDLKISLEDMGAKCKVYGLFLLKESLHCHINVNIEHRSEYTFSDQIIKGTLKDSSRSSFESTVLIDKKAQKSVSKQLNKNLLLSEKAEAFSKPFLKVFADDVKASHGATIYKLDEEELFYLTSKGLNLSEASHLLIKGFCQEIVNLVNIKNIKEILFDRMIHYLGT